MPLAKIHVMTFAIIDAEGSTVDTFDSALDARGWLRGYLREEPNVGALEDLLVLEYRHGVRVGRPRDAMDFLAGDPSNVHAFALSAKSPKALVAVATREDRQGITGPEDGSPQELQLTVIERIQENLPSFTLRPLRERQSLSHC